MKVWQKLSMIAAAFTLPIAVLLILVISGINYHIGFADAEIAGNEYQRALEVFLEHLSEHRLLAQAIAAGDQSRIIEVGQKQLQIEEDLESLEEVDRRLGGVLQTTPAELARRRREHYRVSTLLAEWNDLKAQVIGQPAARSDERHLHLIADLRTLISYVGDSSKLILDPDLDTYYMMDMTLLALPQSQDRIQQVMTFGAEALRKRALTDAERIQFEVYAALMKETDLDRIKSSAEAALREDVNFFRESQRFQRNLPPAVNETANAMEGFIAIVRRAAAGAEVEVTPEEFSAAGVEAFKASFKLWAVSSEELGDLLGVRRLDYLRDRRAALLLTLLSVAVSSLLVFFIIRSITRPLGRAVEVANQVKEGNLVVSMDVKGRDETAQLLHAIRNMARRLGEGIHQVRSVADAVAMAAGQVTSASQNLSYGTGEQAASMQETASSLEDMTTSIARNAEHSGQMAQMALNGVRAVRDGGVAMEETVSAMKAISARISVIEEIAHETNLLALNAAIEAARAGEQGRGFTIVASEVRKLAERCQAAAKEIGDLAVSSVRAANSAGHMLEALAPSIKQTADFVQDVAVVSSGQANGVAQINQAMLRVDQVTQRNASAAEHLASMAKEMGAQAKALQASMALFRIDAQAARNE